MNEFERNNNEELSQVVTVKEWLISLLIMLIPIVNIVMTFVWAFGDGNKSKSNFFKASLIFAVISIALSIVFSGLFISLFASMFENSYY